MCVCACFSIHDFLEACIAHTYVVFFLNVTWIGPITVVMVLFVTCMFFTRGDFTLDLSIEFLEKVTMYTSVTTCKSFSSSRSLIHVLAWQEGKKKKILESNRRTARKNKAIFAHTVWLADFRKSKTITAVFGQAFWCQFGASTHHHNSRFLLCPAHRQIRLP